MSAFYEFKTQTQTADFTATKKSRWFSCQQSWVERIRLTMGENNNNAFCIREVQHQLIWRLLLAVEFLERRHHHRDTSRGRRMVGGNVGQHDGLVPEQLRQGHQTRCVKCRAPCFHCCFSYSSHVPRDSQDHIRIAFLWLMFANWQDNFICLSAFVLCEMIVESWLIIILFWQTEGLEQWVPSWTTSPGRHCPWPNASPCSSITVWWVNLTSLRQSDFLHFKTNWPNKFMPCREFLSGVAKFVRHWADICKWPPDASQVVPEASVFNQCVSAKHLPLSKKNTVQIVKEEQKLLESFLHLCSALCAYFCVKKISYCICGWVSSYLLRVIALLQTGSTRIQAAVWKHRGTYQFASATPASSRWEFQVCLLIWYFCNHVFIESSAAFQRNRKFLSSVCVFAGWECRSKEWAVCSCKWPRK